MTWRLAICIWAVAGVSSLAAQSPYPTAAFTLDVESERFFRGTETPLHVQFDEWVRNCRIVQGGALYVLQCEPAEVRVRSFEDSELEAIDVSIALFRDLDEAIYLAGCPTVEELKRLDEQDNKQAQSGRRVAESETERDEKKAREDNRRNCGDLEPGQTFSVEVEGEEMRIVVRGRHLPFTVFGYRPKDTRIGTYDKPPITSSAPRIGPLPRVDESGMPRKDPPLWHLPPLRSIARSARLKGQDEPLRTGRLVVACDTPGPVYVDEAYMGLCPLDMPLIAGPHKLAAKRQARSDWQREFRLETGKTVEIRVPAAR